MIKSIIVTVSSLLFCLHSFADSLGIDNVNLTKVKKNKWQCKYCQPHTPQAEAWYGQWSIGTNYISEQQASFKNIKDFDQGLNFDGSFDLTYLGKEDAYTKLWYTGIDGTSQQSGLNTGTEFGYFSGGRIKITYTDNSHYKPQSGLTAFDTLSGNSLTLPSNWQHGENTAAMEIASQSLSTIDYQLQREKLIAAFDYNGESPWLPTLSYSREKKSGIKLQAGFIDSHAALIPNQVSYVTDSFDTGLTFKGNSWLLNTNYHYSQFNNENTELSWDSPYILSDDSVYSLAPDNDFHQLRVLGRYKTADTQIAAKMMFGLAKQDEIFVEPLDNSQSLSGENQTSRLSLQVNHKLTSKARLTAKVEQYNKNSNTQQLSYEDRQNRTLDFTDTKLSLVTQIKHFDFAKVKLGFKAVNKERPQQERVETNEHIYWLYLKDRKLDWADINLKYSYSYRDGSEFKSNTQSKNPQNEELRRYHLADRDRNEIKVDFSYPINDNIQTEITAFYAKDDYRNTLIGLQKGKDRMVDLSLLGQLSEVNWHIYVAHEKIDYQSAGSSKGTTANFLNIADNETNQFGLSFNSPKVIDNQFDLSLDYNFTLGAVNQSVDQGRSGNFGDYPTNKYQHHQATLLINYFYSEKSRYSVEFIFERNDDSDYFNSGADIDTLSNVLTSGVIGDQYRNIYMGLSFTQKL